MGTAAFGADDERVVAMTLVSYPGQGRGDSDLDGEADCLDRDEPGPWFYPGRGWDQWTRWGQPGEYGWLIPSEKTTDVRARQR